MALRTTGAIPAGRWELVNAHRDRLRRLVISRLGWCDDVEDYVQEALVRAASFEGLDEQRVGQLLTTITLRLCVDHHRGQARSQRLLARSVAEHEESADAAICERAVGSWLLAQADTLAPRERDVMLARAHGMTTAAAAKALNISSKSAESAFTRGRNRLRALYDVEMAHAHGGA